MGMIGFVVMTVMIVVLLCWFGLVLPYSVRFARLARRVTVGKKVSNICQSEIGQESILDSSWNDLGAEVRR